MTGAATVTPPDVYVADTGTPLGRGVFAARAFVAGEIVEVSPVVALAGPYRSLPKPLQDIVFFWPDRSKPLLKHALVLGYGSVYNHSDTPTMRYEDVLEEQAVHFIAVRDITADEQLTISYDQPPSHGKTPKRSWFERNSIKKLAISDENGTE